MKNEWRAWSDWLRVEDCIMFGIQRWALTVLGLWAADHWLKPISDVLAAIADVGVLLLHFHFAKRTDKRMRSAVPRT